MEEVRKKQTEKIRKIRRKEGAVVAAKSVRKAWIYGSSASAILLGVYLLVLSAANSFSHAVEQFILLWYWMIPLVGGFGLQVGLYKYGKEAVKGVGAGSSVAVSGGVSTASMVACCAHHLSDVLPLIGLSAAAFFVARYQTPFLLVGVVSNSIGLNILLKDMQKHGMYHNEGVIEKLFKYDMGRVLRYNILLSGIILSISISGFIGG